MSTITIEEIISEFGPTKDIWELNLDARGLSELPAEIEQLSQLQQLSLDGNQLTELPAELWTLSKLQYLSLDGNQLTELSPEVGRLSQLRDLTVSNNKLTRLPREIGNLSRLQDLSVSNNELTEIPVEIKKLSQLQFLYLDNNRLTRIPIEIGELSSLQYLYLDSNQLTEIPMEIGNLLLLESLFLYHNKLKKIPVQICKLNQLQILHLFGNEIIELPREIGNLSHLHSLSLSGNLITELPVQLGELTELENLSVRSTPLRTPSPEILSQGTASILQYLRDLADDGDKATRQYISKLLVVGQGGVGKTQLLAALRDEEFNEHSDTTHGLNVRELKIQHPQEVDEVMTLNTWDFAGQDIEHATHQFFLSNRSLFLLVWNARHGYEQSKVHYWLDTIRAKAPQAPILLVATHVEEGRDADLPLADLKREYPQIAGSFSVSNRARSGFEDLRREICHQAAALPLMGELWPSKWLAAADAVRALDAKHCRPEKIFAVMAQHGVDNALGKMLLRWLHDLGELLHFADNPALCDLVVLQPQWVREYISRVLEDESVINSRGLFTKADMERLWGDLSLWVRLHLLEMMEQFDLSYRTLENEEVSLVVERLPHENQSYAELWEAKQNETAVTLIYQLDSIPAGIPTWFIARSHRFSSHIHWRTGALFQQEAGEIPRHLALLKTDVRDRSIQLSVRGPYPQNFLALLRDGFEQTLERFPGLKVKRQIPCPCQSKENPCSYLFDYDLLLARRKPQIECPISEEDVEVSTLLFGLDWKRKDEVLKQLTQIQNEIREAQASNNEQLEEIRNLTELTQRGFLNIFHREQELPETYCPNVFTLRQLEASAAKQKIIGQKLELHLCCQAPGHWHPTEQEGRYEITDSAEWLKTAAPYLKKLVGLMKYAAPLVGPGVGMASAELFGEFRANLDFTKELVKNLPDITSDREIALERESTSDEHTRVEGAQLRWLRTFLDEKDPSQNWGGLQRVLTPEGHYLWLCDEHRKEYR
jgi:internalin A